MLHLCFKFYALIVSKHYKKKNKKNNWNRDWHIRVRLFPCSLNSFVPCALLMDFDNLNKLIWLQKKKKTKMFFFFFYASYKKTIDILFICLLTKVTTFFFYHLTQSSNKRYYLHLRQNSSRLRVCECVYRRCIWLWYPA